MLSHSPLELINPISALVAGFITSLHCVGMCGPLACSILTPDKGRSKAMAIGGYHIGKLLSYSIVGGLAGALGGQFITTTTGFPSQLLTWSMAIFFLLVAVGVDRLSKGLPLVGRASQRLMRWAYQTRGDARGLALGLATPFIPCGPLYVIVWVAAMAGSAFNGALMLALFGLGTIPALLAANLGWNALSVRLGPNRLARWKRNAAIIACALLIARSFIDPSYASVFSGDSLCH